MEFTRTFAVWVNIALLDDLPANTRAFCFNLFMPADPRHKFGVELIASDKFDLENENWACSEIWEATPRQLFIPNEFAGQDWKQCLSNMTSLVTEFVKTKNSGAAVLRRYHAIAIGFVDGDLDIVYKKLDA